MLPVRTCRNRTRPTTSRDLQLLHLHLLRPTPLTFVQNLEFSECPSSAFFSMMRWQNSLPWLPSSRLQRLAFVLASSCLHSPRPQQAIISTSKDVSLTFFVLKEVGGVLKEEQSFRNYFVVGNPCQDRIESFLHILFFCFWSFPYEMKKKNSFDEG